MGVLGKLGGIVMARMNLKIYQWAIELLEVEPSDRILEIGFGPGVGIQLLASAVSSGRVAGVDASEEMLEQASVRNANSLGTGRGDLQQASVESLPFKDASFDKVLAVNSMRVWPDAIAELQEIRRVLKPGGRVVLGFTRYSGQAKEDLAEALTVAGFANARVVDKNNDFCAIATNPGPWYATSKSRQIACIIRNHELKVVVHEAEEGGYWTEVPSIPGCATQGGTFEEPLQNLYEAVEGCLSVDVSPARVTERDRILEIAV